MHTGWRTRGYLPHYDGADMTQHVVFGLADAFPNENEAPVDADQRRTWRESYLDRGVGACVLRAEAAEVVQEALLHFDGLRYALMAWCVMPNHVHVLAITAHGWPLGKIVHSWKSFSANGINALLNRTGRLWRREYYDHFVRSEEEFQATTAYIENNPVKAKLVNDAAAWPFSSAWRGWRGE